nr:MAG TPA: hypothetical protein [Caudoviricetes sp.]
MLYCMCKELREAPYDSTIHLLYIFLGGRETPSDYDYGVMWCLRCYIIF